MSKRRAKVSAIVIFVALLVGTVLATKTTPILQDVWPPDQSAAFLNEPELNAKIGSEATADGETKPLREAGDSTHLGSAQSISTQERGRVAVNETSESGGVQSDGMESFRFKGEGLFLEQIRNRRDELRSTQGLPPFPKPPYLPQLKRVYLLLSEQGFSRSELHEHYVAVIIREELSLEVREKATKSRHLDALISSLAWQDVRKFLDERLRENDQDLPALLLRFDLHWAEVKIDEMFDDITRLLPVVAELDSKEFDRRAILYDVLTRLETFVYGGESWMEANRARVERNMRQGNLVTPSLKYLYLLELEGYW